jgi:hypothetical protein
VVSQTEVRLKAFSWFAYMDTDPPEARAIAPMLGLLIVRPNVHEAEEELFAVAKEYLELQIRNGEDVARPTPSEAWEAHLLKFIWQCSARPDKRGQLWACGFIQKDLSRPEWDE